MNLVARVASDSNFRQKARAAASRSVGSDGKCPEDHVAEAVLKTLQLIASGERDFSSAEDVQAYLIAICRNSAGRAAMRDSNLRGILESFEDHERRKPRDPDLLAEYNDSLRLIEERLGPLDPDDENVARRRWLDELPASQVAREVGATKRVMARRMEKIRERMRHMLSGDFADGQIVGTDSGTD